MTKGAVVCPEPLAAQTGARILELGGNAVDAVVAASFTQGVVNPLMCGIGGAGRMLLYEADSKTTTLINFGSQAGSKAHEHIYDGVEPSVFSNRYKVKEDENYIGHKAATIPTVVRGLWDSHQRYGLLPWEALLEDAIHYAEKGFEVYPYIYQFWDPERQTLSDSPPPLVKLNATQASADIYLNKGQPYGVGERLLQRDYASTLKRIASEGADVFYKGDIAKAMADDMEANGGLFTLEDLISYRSNFEVPTKGQFKHFEVATDGFPSMGPFMIQAFNILRHLNIQRLEWRSPVYYDLLARLLNTVYAERSSYGGDPAFVTAGQEIVFSDKRARELAQKLKKASGSEEDYVTPSSGGHHTTHLSVLDKWGNAAGHTHSNGNTAGVVTPGLGFLYNHHMHNFDARPGQRNSVAAGKRPNFGCSPLMLLANGELKYLGGSLTRYRVSAELQLLLDVYVFGADVQEAVMQPRIHAEYAPDTLYVEPAFPSSLRQGLLQRGWELQNLSMTTPMCSIFLPHPASPEVARDPRGGGGWWLES